MNWLNWSQIYFEKQPINLHVNVVNLGCETAGRISNSDLLVDSLMMVVCKKNVYGHQILTKLKQFFTETIIRLFTNKSELDNLSAGKCSFELNVPRSNWKPSNIPTFQPKCCRKKYSCSRLYVTIIRSCPSIL